MSDIFDKIDMRILPLGYKYVAYGSFKPVNKKLVGLRIQIYTPLVMYTVFRNC